jgi:hypothetical protein
MNKENDDVSVEVEIEGSDVELEVVDDTPEQDRGRTPAPPPEDVSDDELTQYSESVQKRIRHFTRGYHDERRAKEAALREREEAVRLAQSVLEENKRLQGTLGKTQAVSLDQARKVADNELEAAKKKLRDAHEAFDSEALADAQVALNMASIRAERLANMRVAPVQSDETAVKPQQQQRAPDLQQPVDEKALRWKEKNTWFGTDPEKTSFALGFHTKLVNEGVDPQSDEYYSRVNQRMRQVFPELSDADDTPKTKRSAVAPVSRSTAPKKIVLSQSQVNVAKRLGVSLEDYAKQVALEMRKQNG